MPEVLPERADLHGNVSERLHLCSTGPRTLGKRRVAFPRIIDVHLHRIQLDGNVFHVSLSLDELNPAARFVSIGSARAMVVQ